MNINLVELFNKLPCSIYWKDMDGSYLGCNDFMARMAGLDLSHEIIGKTDYDLPWQDHADAMRSIDKEVIKAGIEKIFEETIQISNGQLATFLTTKQLLHDTDSKVIGVYGMSVDISKYKQTENYLIQKRQDAEQQAKGAFLNLEHIIACMPGSVFWKDAQGVYQGCNDEFANMLGLSKFEIIGKTDHDFTKIYGSTEIAKAFRKVDKHVFESGMPKLNIKEPPFRLASGKIINQLANKVPLRDENGEVIGVVGIGIDITKIEEALHGAKVAAGTANAKAQAEEELRQAVMVLTGSIVHDLRTPIMTVKYASKIIESTLPKLMDGYQKAVDVKLIDNQVRKGHQEYIGKVSEILQQTSDQMNDFIDNTLITLSKSLMKQMNKSDLTICSSDHCIAQMIRYYPFFDSNERYLIHWDRSYDFEFSGNEILMIRVLINLLKNSLAQIKANNKGEIYITCKQGENENILRIKDTAGGATPKVVKNIFKGYYTTKEGGTGIGLAFCKKTMQDFGGGITAHSVYGDYIEFSLTFPKVKASSS